MSARRVRRNRPIPCVLTIAGSDSGAGAGIQADARTIPALGGSALPAITAVTAQNGRGVVAWEAVPARLISAQITAVLDGFPVSAIKTGLLPGAVAIRAVARALHARQPIRGFQPKSSRGHGLEARATSDRGSYQRLALVVDPVMGSTSGMSFLSPRGAAVLKRELLPLAALVTPNWPEAEELTGLRVRSARQAEAAARALARECGCAVLVKGGHGRGRTCRDCLVTAGGRVRWYTSPRIATRNTHGTGCVLASAIALELARGRELGEAVRSARRFLWKSLNRSKAARWGRGSGPAFAG